MTHITEFVCTQGTRLPKPRMCEYVCLFGDFCLTRDFTYEDITIIGDDF